MGIGSNIEAERNVREALLRLARRTRITAISTFYRSRPLSRPEQPSFVNGAVELETEASPEEVKHGLLRGIEAELGRVRTADKYAPRTIDLDLLIYNDRVIRQPDLRVPDPEIQERPFLAIPLAELAPDMALPGDGRALREIAAAFPDHALEPLASYTEELRESLQHEPRESEATGKRAAD